jgi:hypothetical protein
MQFAALCHTELAGENAALQAMMSSAAESVLGCSPSNTSHAEVVGELVADF